MTPEHRQILLEELPRLCKEVGGPSARRPAAKSTGHQMNRRSSWPIRTPALCLESSPFRIAPTACLAT